MQGWAIIILIVISTIAFGVNVKIDTSKIGESGLLSLNNKLGWQLLWIMTVAVTFANLFHEVLPLLYNNHISNYFQLNDVNMRFSV